MRSFGSSRALLVVLVLAFVAAAIAAYGTGAAFGTSGEDHDHAAAVEIANVEVDYAFDPKDERKLVGFADNVFFGRVVQRVGTEGLPTSKPGETIKQTQFSVEVGENVKGQLAGTVTVNQEGGRDEQAGALELVEGDPLLTPGQEYLFVTRYDEGNDWHTIAAQPYGDVKVKDGADKKALKDKFEKAKKEEIPYDPAAPQSPADVEEEPRAGAA